ncbi:HlyD family secretion protein [Thiomicrorhabdus heinhorstiae]|uniref:HlyD family efflux transporter periplasmic adaptor subunit n=1 Tax=Thiomicrorhabdus heinhorstiae TaxID=2748010 RepID=A0ABS0BT64_9GAMM|nr:HlyD family efflux transporter periplasmic adaptor subunit [Thiomicrorhabdus heinhorstiae]MBF6057033.1 HlyD family efflux transporter periplasmic adaptor subunit [Thiomicrorhabdus heinhorstiae]
MLTKLFKLLITALALLNLFSTSVAYAETDSSPNIYHGYVEADYSYIAAPASGWLKSVDVKEGDQVIAGQPLFFLDDDYQKAQVKAASEGVNQSEAQWKNLQSGARKEELDVLDAQLKEAKAQLKLAAAEKQRWSALVKKGTAAITQGDQAQESWEVAKAQVRLIESNIAVSKLAAREEEQKAAEAAVQQAKSQLSQAQWQLDQRSVYSQIQGRVEQRFHYPGEFVTAGSPVLSILPPKRLKVKFFVGEAELSDLHLGQQVEIKRDGQTQSLPAEIRFISDSASYTPPVIFSNAARQKLVFLVEARLKQGSLRPGQPVDVLIP